jgi:hypothetical protein
MMSAWTFPVKFPAQKARNPISDEFFDSPEVLTDVSSLVRESIQNSIDARVNLNEPVKVVIRIGQLDSASSAGYFNGLQEHLEAVFDDGAAPTAAGVCRYLVIEDFNTTGLTGDTNRDTAPVGQEENSSYTYFVHVEGQSNKGEGKKGKWGVGKIVFQKLSELKTFFVFSERRTQDAPDGVTKLWLGQSILKFHNLNGFTYQPDGWFANQDPSGIYVPYTEEVAENFASGWGIERSSQPGLSVVIPYISESVKLPSVRDAVIREYFVPIIKGDLECTLIDEAGELTELRSDNLDAIAAGIEMEKLLISERTSAEMEEAIKSVSAAVRNETAEFSLVISDDLPKIADLSVDEDLVTQIREAFETGNPLRITCKIGVPLPKTGQITTDTFEVLLKKSDVARSATFYAREGILVPGKRNAGLVSCVSLALVEAGPLANLLGSAEGPAHDSWSSGTDKFKTNYGSTSKATRLIPIVRGTAEKILQLISSQSGSFDLHILDEFFKRPNKPNSGKTPPKPTHPVVPPVVPPPLPKVTQLANVKANGNGFEVYTSDHTNLEGKALNIRLAYEVNRGNPFAKYSPLDFDLSTKAFQTVGCRIVKNEGNNLVISVENNAFSVSCPDFDPLRDLEVELSIGSPARKSGDTNA